MVEISYIIPVYNIRKEWIKRCIDSLISQTYSNIEIIVIDDGSNDETARYCDDMCQIDDRIRVFHQKNLGVSVARNTGVDNAKGTLVCYVDPDDWVEKNHAEKIISIYNKEKFDMLSFGYYDYKQSGIVCNLWNKHNLEIGEYYKFNDYEKRGILLRILQDEKASNNYPMFFGAQWNIAYDRNFLNSNNLRNPKNIVKSEDAVFNLYAIEKAKTILYLKEPLYYYFINNESVCTKYNTDVDRFINLFIEFEKYLKLHNKYEDAEFYNAYCNFGIIAIMTAMKIYFFNEKNLMSKKQIKKEYNNFINKYPFNHILKTMDMSKLSFKKKIFVLSLKNKWFNLSKILFNIKKNII